MDPVTAALNFLTALTVEVFPVIMQMIQERKIKPDTALDIAVKIVRGINRDHHELSKSPIPSDIKAKLAHEAIRITMVKEGMEPSESDVNWFMEQAVKIVRKTIMGPDAPDPMVI